MSIYSVDFEAFVRDYTPPNKREAQTLAWLNAVFVPLGQLHADTFDVYKPYIEDRAKQNGQRIVLESILNESFSIVAPPYIYIDNSGDDASSTLFFNEGEGLPGVTFFNVSEAQPPEYFINSSETNNNRDFVVYVPTAVYSAVGEDAIKDEIDRLKPYGTFYTIIQY
jgi:hypothetical protein